ncbi:MAG: hypothetical protein QME59_00490 [Candidatus Hydrothermarchaeota archaeon]|nr:hypothetical protein [Candidatus Hydrothermarchaeota archaeon]
MTIEYTTPEYEAQEKEWFAEIEKLIGVKPSFVTVREGRVLRLGFPKPLTTAQKNQVEALIGRTLKKKS